MAPDRKNKLSPELARVWAARGAEVSPRWGMGLNPI